MADNRTEREVGKKGREREREGEKDRQTDRDRQTGQREILSDVLDQ